MRKPLLFIPDSGGSFQTDASGRLMVFNDTVGEPDCCGEYFSVNLIKWGPPASGLATDTPVATAIQSTRYWAFQIIKTQGSAYAAVLSYNRDDGEVYVEWYDDDLNLLSVIAVGDTFPISWMELEFARQIYITKAAYGESKIYIFLSEGSSDYWMVDLTSSTSLQLYDASGNRALDGADGGDAIGHTVDWVQWNDFDNFVMASSKYVKVAGTTYTMNGLYTVDADTGEVIDEVASQDAFPASYQPGVFSVRPSDSVGFVSTLGTWSAGTKLSNTVPNAQLAIKGPINESILIPPKAHSDATRLRVVQSEVQSHGIFLVGSGVWRFAGQNETITDGACKLTNDGKIHPFNLPTVTSPIVYPVYSHRVDTVGFYSGVLLVLDRALGSIRGLQEELSYSNVFWTLPTDAWDFSGGTHFANNTFTTISSTSGYYRYCAPDELLPDWLTASAVANYLGL